MRVFIAVWLLIFSLAVYCNAQSEPGAGEDATLNRRIETLVRDKYNLPPGSVVTIGTRGPSQFGGYQKLSITISYASQSQAVDFLLSNDGGKLVRMDSFDLTSDPVFHIDIAGRPVRGNPNAKVTVVTFDDLECPYCAELYKELYPSTFARYGSQVRFIYMYFPLTQHLWATHAAVDANCLATQNSDTYWNYVDYLHRHVDQIAGDAQDLKKSFVELDRIARDEGTVSSLDRPELEQCIAKQDESAVRSSMAQAAALGVRQVPTLYINGERIDGVFPKDQIWAVIDRALTATGEMPPPATKP